MFSKDIEKICANCVHATELQKASQLLCKHKGVVPAGLTCRRFDYDPLKRVPHRQTYKNEFKPEDFSLD